MARSPLIRHGAWGVTQVAGLGRLCVPGETFAWLEERGIEAHVARTPAAIEIYNRLVEEGRPVGGLFHSTC